MSFVIYVLILFISDVFDFAGARTVYLFVFLSWLVFGLIPIKITK